jgi:hypothetical protein
MVAWGVPPLGMGLVVSLAWKLGRCYTRTGTKSH